MTKNKEQMKLSLEIAGKSDIGCVRANNEDHLGWDAEAGILVVCDGMGGAAAGEVASRMAVEVVLQYFREGGQSGNDPQSGSVIKDVSARAQRLASAIHKANAAIYRAAMQNPAQQGMGSTIVAIAVAEGQFSVAHVGDSRVYLLRDGTIRQLTEDHSFVTEMVRRGIMGREAAEASGLRNVITRALGSEAEVRPDVRDWPTLPHDVLLLASDGLTRQINDESIRNIVEQAPSLDAACDRLIAAAKESGGEDNITCLLLRMTA